MRPEASPAPELVPLLKAWRRYRINTSVLEFGIRRHNRHFLNFIVGPDPDSVYARKRLLRYYTTALERAESQRHGETEADRRYKQHLRNNIKAVREAEAGIAPSFGSTARYGLTWRELHQLTEPTGLVQIRVTERALAGLNPFNLFTYRRPKKPAKSPYVDGIVRTLTAAVMGRENKKMNTGTDATAAFYNGKLTLVKYADLPKAGYYPASKVVSLKLGDETIEQADVDAERIPDDVVISPDCPLCHGRGWPDNREDLILCRCIEQITGEGGEDGVKVYCRRNPDYDTPTDYCAEAVIDPDYDGLLTGDTSWFTTNQAGKIVIARVFHRSPELALQSLMSGDADRQIGGNIGGAAFTKVLA